MALFLEPIRHERTKYLCDYFVIVHLVREVAIAIMNLVSYTRFRPS